MAFRFYFHFEEQTVRVQKHDMLPSTNSWGNSPGVKCASAKTAALTMTATGVGTL